MAGTYESFDNRNVLTRIFHGQPITLRWRGWQSSTHALEHSGWKISAEEHTDVYNDAHVIRLGCQSPDAKSLISGTICIHKHELMGLGIEYASISPYGGGLQSILNHGIDMQVYTFKDTYSSIPHVDLMSLNRLQSIDIREPTDLWPDSVYRGQLKCFKYVDEPAGQEIFIKPSSVDECLNLILQLQHPEQAKLKKEAGLIMPEKKPLIQAKIFSLEI